MQFDVYSCFGCMTFSLYHVHRQCLWSQKSTLYSNNYDPSTGCWDLNSGPCNAYILHHSVVGLPRVNRHLLNQEQNFVKAKSDLVPADLQHECTFSKISILEEVNILEEDMSVGVAQWRNTSAYLGPGFDSQNSKQEERRNEQTCRGQLISLPCITSRREWALP